MAEVKYLAGKVVRWPLPILTGRPGPDAPTLKRLRLAQGELAQVHDSDEGIHYLATLELREGGVRGNHYHRIKRERVYVLQGRLTVVVEDIQTRERATVPLATGDLLFIEPGIAHALQTAEAGQALEFAPGRFDPADIYPYPLI
ncbi:MAG TPA: cupin domain-containing protein [Verrucomicrobiota bacterium]|nr:cupin domain-containing protein [Verrucomicrobiota bacterium]HRR64369.1 cupin domain-containing protein [Candidatus Paceibacterota bacterium]MBP8014467.1 cupin domain-containing protein [Verrucomicrobiota bacterium]MDI9373591.1 cupin domain-containing protein [Verrucomicrobiota bacterium]NLH85550.1 cupin domain-containing protein [Verrucomicrobiota bacterium]